MPWRISKISSRLCQVGVGARQTGNEAFLPLDYFQNLYRFWILDILGKRDASLWCSSFKTKIHLLHLQFLFHLEPLRKWMKSRTVKLKPMPRILIPAKKWPWGNMCVFRNSLFWPILQCSIIARNPFDRVKHSHS